MAWEARWGLKLEVIVWDEYAPGGLNGLGSPLGIETIEQVMNRKTMNRKAKWPGKPVGD